MLRAACLVLELVGVFGGILHKHHIISYMTVFPVMFLLGSLVALAAGVNGNRYVRYLRSAPRVLNLFPRTAVAGGFIALVVSSLSTAAAIVRVRGSIASGGAGPVLLSISCPTVVISVTSMTMGAVLWWRINRSPEGRPRHAGS